MDESRQSTLASFLRNQKRISKTEAQYLLDNLMSDDPLGEAYNFASSVAAAPAGITSLIAMLLRGAGVIEGDLADFPGTYEWTMENVGADPYAPESILGSFLDPTNAGSMAHLIPFGTAMSRLKGKVSTSTIDDLKRARDEIEQLRATGLGPDEATAQAVLNPEGHVQLMPIGLKDHYFYRPPKDLSRLRTMDEVEASHNIPAQGELTTNLGSIYENPALYQVAPEIEQLPVDLIREDHSMPLRAWAGGGYYGGSYNPVDHRISIPTYPKFTAAEYDALPPEILAQGFAANPPDMLRHVMDRQGLMNQFRQADALARGERFKASVAHETEHALQGLFDLPLGGSPLHTRALRSADLNPMRIMGDQFALPDAQLFNFEVMIKEADSLTSRSTAMSGPSQFETSIMDTLSNTMPQLRQQTQAAMRQQAQARGFSNAQVQDLIADNNMVFDAFEVALNHTADDMHIESARALAAIKRVHPDKTHAEAQHLFDQIWPEVKRQVIIRNINRVSDPNYAYERVWGEATANAASEYMTNALGHADDPTAGQTMAVGRVYDPKLLKVEGKETVPPRWLMDTLQTDDHAHEFFSQRALSENKMNWDRYVRNFIKVN